MKYLGLTTHLLAADPQLLANPVGKRWHALLRANTAKVILSAAEASGYTKEMMVDSFLPQREVLRDEAFAASMWKEVAANADRHNEPGRFSAFAGYEWSSMPEIDNLHRVVIFRDGFDRTSQVRAFGLRQPGSRGTGATSPITSARPAAKCSRSRTTPTRATAACSS